MQKTRKKLFKLISLKILLVSVLFLASLFIFALIANEAVLENEKIFDNKVIAFFSSFSTAAFIQWMKIFTFFGSSYFLLPAYLLLVGFFLVKRKFVYALDIVIIAVTSTVFMQLLKRIFQRHRPDLPIIKGITSYSFPSGHALSAFIFCSILVFIVKNGAWKKTYKWIASVLLMLFALLIGVSRIALKVHYPTDVIASYCLGIVWVIFSFYFLKKIDRKYLVAQERSSISAKG